MDRTGGKIFTFHIAILVDKFTQPFLVDVQFLSVNSVNVSYKFLHKNKSTIIKYDPGTSTVLQFFLFK